MTNKSKGQNLRLTTSQYDQIQIIAAREGFSVAEVVHKAIKEAHPLIKLIADSGLRPVREKPVRGRRKSNRRPMPDSDV